MNEPQHPHFVLADASYAHVLEEGIIVGKKELPKEKPVQKDTPDPIALLLYAAGCIITIFFIVMCAITGMWVVVAMMGAMFALLIVALLRTLKFSNSMYIPRADISGIEYYHRNMGYDYFILNYSGKNGKNCRRRFTIYDSQECLDQALKVVKAQGWLKP